MAVGSLLQRRFALVWTIRLREAGLPVTWAWALVTFLLVISMLAAIWSTSGRTGVGGK